MIRSSSPSPSPAQLPTPSQRSEGQKDVLALLGNSQDPSTTHLLLTRLLLHGEDVSFSSQTTLGGSSKLQGRGQRRPRASSCWEERVAGHAVHLDICGELEGEGEGEVPRLDLLTKKKKEK